MDDWDERSKGPFATLMSLVLAHHHFATTRAKAGDPQ